MTIEQLRIEGPTIGVQQIKVPPERRAFWMADLFPSGDRDDDGPTGPIVEIAVVKQRPRLVMLVDADLYLVDVGEVLNRIVAEIAARKAAVSVEAIAAPPAEASS